MGIWWGVPLRTPRMLNRRSISFLKRLLLENRFIERPEAVFKFGAVGRKSNPPNIPLDKPNPPSCQARSWLMANKGAWGLNRGDRNLDLDLDFLDLDRDLLLLPSKLGGTKVNGIP